MSTPIDSVGHDEEPVRAEVNARVHAQLFRAKLTKRSLAEKLGLGTTATSRKLNGHAPWTLEELVRLADALSTSVAYLIGEVDDDAPLRKTKNAPTDSSERSDSVAGAGFEPATSRL